MKINPLTSLRFAILGSFMLLCLNLTAQQGKMVPTNASQSDFLNAYKMALDFSDADYRSTSSTMDKVLFPDFGEHSVYWSASGASRGSFIIPDTLGVKYANVSSTSYSGFSWTGTDNYSLQFKRTAKTIAIFRSKLKADGYSLSWESSYFKTLFETFLFADSYYFVDEDNLTADALSDSTRLLIIPSFTVHSKGDKVYIDTIFSKYPAIASRLQSFLAQGGTIYTEGNAVYVTEKLGYISAGGVDFSNTQPASSNYVSLTNIQTLHPVAFSNTAVNDKVYAGSIPMITLSGGTIIAKAATDNRPVIFTLTGNKAGGGRIVCNLGIPTVGGISEVESGSRQLQWSLNTILYAFANRIDVTHAVYNQFTSGINVNRNAVSHDRVDTFEVHIQLRNLSTENISGITLNENLRGYYKFIDVTSGGISASENNGIVTLSGISLNAKAELTIIYRLASPDPDNAIHESVDKFIDSETLMAAAVSTVSYDDSEGHHQFTKKRGYADVMFSARIFGDADVNWKNFLSLEYQPFKVFMIMENKERTDADSVVYTQYIPKDVPFYWVDKGLNIPILKTPGGKFVDVLKGSDNENAPEYDLDSDGKPDVWLDTTSIFPKGYILEQDSVYWLNPWTKKYEDINHDGNIAQDTNGDGIVEVQAPGDKMRVWKVTWKVGTVRGYDYFDPYCSYEVWVDPPDLVKLAAGVGYAYKKCAAVDGMFYPYTPNIAAADTINNKSWQHWMEWDSTNNRPEWLQLIFQSVNNYQGYAFIDTLKQNYKLTPKDSCVGTVPHPREEFIAVLSMGGEEIDMYHPTPQQSLYSKIDYKTVFNEKRCMPIRTTYTYYAPLPNPLQFEYLASNFSIIDSMGLSTDHLPAKGKATLQFDLDASTEYTYYWIRNVGHKTERIPGWIKDTVSGMGHGVFGYLIYEIPKGMGGYQITLPKNADGSYNIDSIVQVDGSSFLKWLDNPNTANQVEIWEDPFTYQIYIPQVLIPPAIDDDNFDGIDDWIDDKGDRFMSKTGYLHDTYMPGNGEDYPNSPATPFEDKGYGTVTSGWNIGADNANGDDIFETLGKTHFTFFAYYHGKGKEGPVDISKGGTLVVEEIFGGSPWVIFSHALSGYAKGVNYQITSSVSPTAVKYGSDTVCIKHVIEDKNEPHEFNGNFNPYHVSVGTKEATVTALAGGKDPCSLLSPNINTTTIIDPSVDHKTDITLIPSASSSNPDLTGYPRKVSGTFLEVKVEVMNGTNDNWYNTTVTPNLSAAGNTSVEMQYVAYPRPLVPDDQPGTFTTGWRFNQPEGEVIVKMGNSMNVMQPTRRAYFIFLLKIDETLANGIYNIAFTINGTRMDYKGNNNGTISLTVPDVKFSIVEKTSSGNVVEYQKIFIDKAPMKNLTVNASPAFASLNQVRWAGRDVNYTDFDKMNGTLASSFSNNTEVIDLSTISRLPNSDTSKVYILEKVAVNSYQAGEPVSLTAGEALTYTYPNKGDMSVQGNKLSVSPYGPKIVIKQSLYSVDGVPVEDTITINDSGDLYFVTRLDAINVGSDVSVNTNVTVYPGPFYKLLTDSLKSNIALKDGLISVSLGTMVPGETKTAYLYFRINESSTTDDVVTVIQKSDIAYTASVASVKFNYTDSSKVYFSIYDFKLLDLQYVQTANNRFTVTAKALNRGIQANYVWLRIYPIVDGGISEFPIAQMRIDTFKVNQTVELTVDYTAPDKNKVELIAIIDDGDYITEAIEKNNSAIVDLPLTTDVNESRSKITSTVYPNPFADKVRFSYQLPADAKAVSLSVFTQSGAEVVRFVNCPSTAGQQSIDWAAWNLPAGNYLYKLTITGKDDKVSIIQGVLIKTK
jgi:hypothetical protein